MTHKITLDRCPAWFDDFSVKPTKLGYLVTPLSKQAKDYLFGLNNVHRSKITVPDIDKFAEKLPFTAIFIYL